MKRLTLLLVLATVFAIPFFLRKMNLFVQNSSDEDPRFDLDEYLAEHGL